MAYRDLREFVKALDRAGELKRVKSEVDPELEITEVTQRIARDPNRAKNSVGPALLFEKPKGSRYPLLVNTFGSVKRMCMAFEVEELDEVAARIRGFLDTQDTAGTVRQDQDVAQAGGAGIILSQECEGRRLQAVDS